MPNIIGGVTAANNLSYGTSIIISFFDPSNSAVKAVTDFVGIRGDQVPLLGATATMEAFDVIGNSLGNITANDSTSGLLLSLNLGGIHSIHLTQNSASTPFDGTIGFDNLSFNQVQPAGVPEPTTLALMGLGLAGIGYRRRQLKKA